MALSQMGSKLSVTGQKKTVYIGRGPARSSEAVRHGVFELM